MSRNWNNTERGLERADRWLGKRGLRTAPEPVRHLLAARLACRVRGLWLQGILVGIAVVLYFNLEEQRHSSPRNDIPRLAWQGGMLLVMALGFAGSLVIQRRVLRRVSAGLARRVARPTRVGLVAVTGRMNLATGIVTYAGGLIIAITGASLATSAPDRRFAQVLGAGVLVFGAIAVVAMADVVRRPALATDAGSLVIDDLFRTEDAYAALTPYPGIFGALVAAGGGLDSGFRLVLIGYAAAVATGSQIARYWLTKLQGRSGMMIRTGMIDR